MLYRNVSSKDMKYAPLGEYIRRGYTLYTTAYAVKKFCITKFFLHLSAEHCQGLELSCCSVGGLMYWTALKPSSDIHSSQEH